MRLRALVTCGCHNRADFARLDPRLQVNFVTSVDDSGRLVEPQARPIPAVPDDLLPWVDRARP